VTTCTPDNSDRFWGILSYSKFKFTREHLGLPDFWQGHVPFVFRQRNTQPRVFHSCLAYSEDQEAPSPRTEADIEQFMSTRPSPRNHGPILYGRLFTAIEKPHSQTLRLFLFYFFFSSKLVPPHTAPPARRSGAGGEKSRLPLQLGPVSVGSGL